VIRIVRDGVVVFESESLYEVADWLYYEDEEVKELVVTSNEEAHDKTKATKR